MNTLYNLIIIVQVLSALAIIGLVLLQHGKGADMGAAFGSGASGSLFGASGSSNFLSRSTGVAAAVFFAATMALTLMGTNKRATSGAGVMDSVPVQTTPTTSVPAPAAPAAPAAVEPAAKPAAEPASEAGKSTSQIPK